MKKYTLFSMLFLFVLFFASPGFCKVTEKELQEKQICGDYKIKIYRNDEGGEGVLKIIKKIFILAQNDYLFIF